MLHLWITNPSTESSFFVGFGVMILIVLHWFFYSIATCLFIAAISNGSGSISSVFDAASLSRGAAALAAVALCSMAGVPPFIGFWTKAGLLLIVSGYGSAGIACACWGVAVVSLFFYLAVLRYSLSLKTINELARRSPEVREQSCASAIFAAVLVLGVLLLGDATLLIAAMFI